MGRTLALAVSALASATAVFAQSGSSGPKCGPGSLCPQDSPCCSQYGQCGVGAYCLGGCDAMFSYQLNSCVPEPVCKSNTYNLSSLDGIVDQTKYLGDSSKADWVSSGTPLQAPTKDAVILTLSQDGASGAGTLMASTIYVWYGKVTITMKSSRGPGIVSAAILLSDNKDEIDFEFIGSDLNTVQSNYYYQGITDYHNEKNITVSNGGDTFDDYHTYVIDWQPDQLTWTVDGSTARTLKKSDTFNKTDNQYHYPQTPARVQLSLWPAGLSKNGQGTVDWAGGLINWNAQDVQTNGYYYAMFKSVEVECYQAPSDAAFNSGNTSYVYNDRTGVEKSIGISGNDTVLKSLLGTGTDMNKDYPNQPSGTKSASAAATSNVATIPGLTGAGPGTDGTRGGDQSGGSNSGSGGSGTQSGSGSASTGVGGFSQGGGNSGSGTKSDAVKVEQVLSGSMFAALMAFVGMLLL